MKREIRHVSARDGYDLWAETYDEAPNPVVIMDSRHSLQVLSPSAGEVILDAGCGTGRNLAGLLEAGARAIGVDFSHGMLAVARRAQPAVPLVEADLQQALPFAAASFDAVLCALVGEHLDDLAATLDGLRRVLKPGGRLVFSVFHPEMAAAGVEANFDIGGIEYRLGAVKYSVQDYIDVVAGADFDEIAFASFRCDSKLAAQLPAAAKYVGFPMLLVIGATTPLF